MTYRRYCCMFMYDMYNIPNCYTSYYNDMANKVANCIKTQLRSNYCCYKRHNLARQELLSKLECYRICLGPTANPGPEFVARTS